MTIKDSTKLDEIDNYLCPSDEFNVRFIFQEKIPKLESILDFSTNKDDD